MTEASGPLQGVRVLDLTNILFGPFGAQTLGDWGADIIKIESLAGDGWRYSGQFRNRGMSGQFMAANRNKRSLALDLKHADGKAVLRHLLPAADVLVTRQLRAALALVDVKLVDHVVVAPGAEPVSMAQRGLLDVQVVRAPPRGRRVKKVAGSVTTVYVYDAFGKLAAEYASPGPAQPPPCERCFLTADHLGSTRLLTDETGAVAAITGVSQDITDRQQMHAALSQRQIQLDGLTVAENGAGREIALVVGERLVELHREGMGKIVQHIFTRRDVHAHVVPFLGRDLGQAALHQGFAGGHDLDDGGIAVRQVPLNRADKRRRLHAGQEMAEESLLGALEG